MCSFTDWRTYVAVFLNCNINTLTIENNLNTSFTLAASSPHLRKLQKELRGGVKSFGTGIAWERVFFHTLWNTLSKCQTPCPCSMSRMWGYGRCQSTVWHKKKALPSPTTLALSLVTASRDRFQPASPLWSCEDIFSPWMSDRRIKSCSPRWVTMQVNLINAITELATKSY